MELEVTHVIASWKKMVLGRLVEIVEHQDHPWFVGVQFHPEYKSTVSNPHPLFVAFIKASIDYLSQQQSN